jgi:hypothetical protein
VTVDEYRASWNAPLVDLAHPCQPNLKVSLREPYVEDCIRLNRDRIKRDAKLVGINVRTYETQVRLHLPALRDELGSSAQFSKMYDRVQPIALVRAAGIRQALEKAVLYANTSLLLPKDYHARRNLLLSADDGSKIDLSFRPVRPSVGYLYQSHLHYLRSVRSDTYLHYGIFLPGAKYPLTYVALSVCDRPYIADSLVASRLNCVREECLVLTRMYGLPGVPKNLMSITLRYVIRALRMANQARVVLTAYNPLLGFTGSAFQASGFRPFAVAPVSYRYTEVGEFTTRRGGADAPLRCHDAPPNVLTVRGVDKLSQKEIISRIRLTKISMKDYTTKTSTGRQLPVLTASDWIELFLDYRKRLENAWSLETIHPSYLGEKTAGPASRGQCGVSSVWLARELHRNFEVDATYCYGDLIFRDSWSKPVNHHCWIEIGDEHDPARMVIDLTCDQADSLSDPVLYDRHDRLLGQGLDYRSKTRLALDDLAKDRVWHRYEALEDAISTSA